MKNYGDKEWPRVMEAGLGYKCFGVSRIERAYEKKKHNFDFNINCFILHATANYNGATERFKSWLQTGLMVWHDTNCHFCQRSGNIPVIEGPFAMHMGRLVNLWAVWPMLIKHVYDTKIVSNTIWLTKSAHTTWPRRLRALTPVLS